VKQAAVTPSLRLCIWSGPRNVSTALMYSFAQRQDTRVLDEPFYAHYLRVSKAPHPGAAEVIASMEPSGQRVVRDVVLGPCDRPILFMKQMAHHLIGLDLDFLKQTRNVLLVRDPVEMLPSLARNLSSPTLNDTGLAVQTGLVEELRAVGQEPPVLDARELLLDPPGVLRQLCQRLDIPFDEAMLHWSPGPRPEDGVWAKYWYHNLHRSMGFQPYLSKRELFPNQLLGLLQECQAHYEILYAMAIKAGCD
jgi:hypothetical protein